MRAALWGRDFEDLDRVGAEPVGDRAAIAITRGRYAKPYPHIDDNEDAVAVVIGASATLLVVCDGHNGATASHRALEAILAELGDDPPPALGDREWLDLFERVNAEVLASTAIGSSQPASRTVLLVALVSDGQLSWGSMGDAALVIGPAGPQRAHQANRELARFVGYPMGRKALDKAVQRGKVKLGERDWVVLATDGLSEYIAPMRPADVVPRVLASAGSPDDAARAIVEAACTAGAGDNVAVAVLAPPR